jgi:hypothetical protein
MPPVELATFFVVLHVPPDRPVAAIRKVLDRKAFHARLRRAVEAVLARYPALKPLTVTLSR